VSERRKLYFAEHVDQAAELYLLASEAVDRRIEWGPDIEMGEVEDEDELAMFLRLKRLRDSIEDGVRRSGLYLRGWANCPHCKFASKTCVDLSASLRPS
jgi:hypothetical protein